MHWSLRSTRPARIRASRRRPMSWSEDEFVAPFIGQAGHKGTALKRVAEPTGSITLCRSRACVATANCRWSMLRWLRGARSLTCPPRCLTSSRPHAGGDLPLGQAHASSFPDEVTELSAIRAQRAYPWRAFDARPDAAVCARRRTDPRCVWPDDLAGQAAGVGGRSARGPASDGAPHCRAVACRTGLEHR